MPVADLTFLREFCRDDRRKMARYVHVFLESMPEVQIEIDRSLREHDADALKKAIHSLKPQVTFMGIQGLKEQVEQIEEHISAGHSMEIIQPQALDLQLLLERASQELVETLVSLS